MNTQAPRFRILTAAEVENIASEGVHQIDLATSSEIEKLTALHRRLCELRRVYYSFLPAQWEKDTLAARMKFRENPTPEGVTALINRLQHEPRQLRDAVSSEMIIAACNLFAREVKPLLIEVMNRGAENLSAKIKELKALEDDWKRSGAVLHTGEIQPSPARLNAERHAAKIARCIARLAACKSDDPAFPPGIPSLLEDVGLHIPDDSNDESAAP